MTRDTVIAAASAAVPNLLRAAGLPMTTAMAARITEVVADALRGVLEEDVPVVAAVDRVERVDERP